MMGLIDKMLKKKQETLALFGGSVLVLPTIGVDLVTMLNGLIAGIPLGTVVQLIAGVIIMSVAWKGIK